MKALRRMALEEALIGAVFLTAAWYVYYLVAIWGLRDYLEFGSFRAYALGPGIHLEMLLSGLGLGVILAAVNHLSEVPAFRQRPFGQIILIKAGLYLMGLATVGLIIHGVFLLFIFSWEEVRELWAMMSLRLTTSLLAWTTLSFLSLTFFLEVRRKVGPGNLWALLTGKYHRPREEKRVFLFLDLKGSTSTAEQLGHARYSQFIRQCFHDLSEFVLLYGAQIYQFVGDEVVLTWPAESEDAGKHSLETFFSFEKRLAERRAWYEEEFGVAPGFRGGVEEGVVTATEVGDIKREIAFHGDALNTAARLLDLCREFKRPILVSGRIQEKLSGKTGWSTELQGEITLRGKAEPIRVYGVDWAVVG